MMTYLYGAALIISVLALVKMAQRNYNNIDVYHWSILLMFPIIIASYWLKSQCTTPDAAYALICFSYLDSTFLFCMVFFYLLHNMGVYVKPWFKIILYGLASVHLLMVTLCYNTTLYYSSVDVHLSDAGTYVKVTSGPLMTFHYIYLAIMLAVMVCIALTAHVRRGKYSRWNFFVYYTLPVLAIILYIVEAAFDADYSLLPVLYGIETIVIALHYDKAHTHDISFIIADYNKKDEVNGYVALSMDGKYLSCNNRAHDFLPFLGGMRVNEKIPEDDAVGHTIHSLIKSFEEDGTYKARYSLGDMTCVCDISYFSLNQTGEHQGYLIRIQDGTEDQRTLDILSDYNKNLNKEVKEKTDSIIEIQQKIVLGMADMIENRDNNTGGHVKRTSDIMRIIIDEIIKRGDLDISEQYAMDIIRAAPMHDLGKLTIDNSILNKPEALTDEEYEIMKTHSVKSGEMVHILLDGVEEEHFVELAYNVARYHHERWDGRGYPEGLVGTMIPLEARIMAVADVYDALVSKRAYKESMTFEEVNNIMLQGMGTQFDPNMKAVFLGCRDKLEEYYS